MPQVLPEDRDGIPQMRAPQGAMDEPLYRLIEQHGQRHSPPLAPFAAMIDLLSQQLRYNRADHLPRYRDGAPGARLLPEDDLDGRGER